MTIEKHRDGSALTLAPEGRLDTITSPELEKALKESLDGVSELTLDFEKLDYISSAGLRVLLTAQKTMNRQGSMKIVHVCETIMGSFEVTGVSEMLNID